MTARVHTLGFAISWVPAVWTFVHTKVEADNSATVGATKMIRLGKMMPKK